jgi:hydrogenase nickel incorporation protein HypA/HybF
MHELPVTENVLEIATKHALEADAIKVTVVNLTIGQLSSIIDDSVKFYWDMITENTICAGSKLNFTRIPAVFRCIKCGYEYGFSSESTACPECNNFPNKLISGEEFYVDSIEIEKGKDERN